MSLFIDLPPREAKPRSKGMTLLIDTGIATGRFVDVIQSHGALVDFVKFGWGTSVVTAQFEAKVRCLREQGIDFCFGGTLFEKAVQQGKVAEYRAHLRDTGCKYVEISNGTIEMDNVEKCRHIADFSKEFSVISEVGYKDNKRSETLYPAQWIASIKQDFAAGAKKVITEARESGKSGICRANGEVRYGLVEEIVAGFDNTDSLIFEAPNKDLQAYFITRIGPNVNLGNIAFEDIIGLETLRLGLRSDTFSMGAVGSR